MAIGTPVQTAIVFACDEAYAFLAQGLVLSLADAGYPNGNAKLFLIDIGCGPQTTAWMTERAVNIVPFDATLIPEKVMSVISPVQRAQVVRPWLPDLFPGFELLIWLDCDLWLQNAEVIHHITAGANVLPQAVIAAPAISNYHLRFYLKGGIEGLLTMQRLWYASCYDEDFANEISNVMHYSSGVVGMRRSSPVWALWRQEIEQVYPVMAARDRRMLHLAEQIALNAVIFRTDQIVRLDPLYNFHCNGGGAVRIANGQVMTNLMLPVREIGVVHLANWSHLRRQYIQNRLLYRGGDYLPPTELQRLAQ